MSSTKVIMTDNECEWDPIKLTSYTGWLKKILNWTNFDVLLTVRLSIFTLVINQLDAQNFVFQ